jgi:hypothetical protein
VLDEILTDLRDTLDGPARREIVADVSSTTTLGAALARLRVGLRSNVWRVGTWSLDLERAIQRCDRKARQVGFHVLHDWDGVADRVNENTIPTDVLDYLVDRRGDEPGHAAVMAILLDYYFVHLLELLTLRVWDESDPDENLDRIDGLLHLLQGPDGSGQRFAADAETLMLIGTSHYELHERGYHVLLEQVRSLGARHRTRIALGHAASMGCHLRFGFEATYGRDTVNMRDDNVADYPWLCFALATLMEEYAGMRDAGVAGEARDQVVAAMASGLTADPRAFIGAPPASLSKQEDERAAFRDRFHTVKTDLLEELERCRPSSAAYSPLCFFFNFAHNVVKGAVIDALLEARPWNVDLNGLLTPDTPAGETASPKRLLAETLMGYARANPQRIRGRLRPVIVYDVQTGREAFSAGMRKLRQT